MASFLGVDLSSSPAKPTAYALLEEDLSVPGLGYFGPDEELLRLAAGHRPTTIAIDAPLGLPRGWYCLETPCSCGQCEEPGADRRRAAEIELLLRRIPCYWTTRRSIIKRMVYRAIKLRRELEASGFPVLEIYPYATKVRLWGRAVPKKSTEGGRAFLYAKLSQIFPSLAREGGSIDHDLADALLAAYTGWLHAQGRTETLGVPEEGQIVLPQASENCLTGLRVTP